MSKLTVEDYNFILKALDSVSIKGIQSSLKLGEVFIKIQNILKELDYGKAGVEGFDGSGPDDAQEEVVSE